MWLSPFNTVLENSSWTYTVLCYLINIHVCNEKTQSLCDKIFLGDETHTSMIAEIEVSRQTKV